MSFFFKINSLSRLLQLGLKALGLLCVAISCTPTDSGGTGNCARPDLAFAGDVLLHSVIQADAAARPEGYAPAFAPLVRALSRAEITVVNLEGPTARNIAPSGRERSDPGTLYDGVIYSGYPRFNYHPSIATALHGAGVDVVQTGNNHAMDRGAIGADLTLSALAQAGLATTGTRPRGGPAVWHAMRRVAGYDLAFVACTFSTNGLADRGNQVLGCYGNNPSIPTLINSLAGQPNVDGVVLLPHWGSEYSARPNARQRRLAQAASEAGALAIVGTHPHVLQPLEVLMTGDGRQVPVAYSLGNLISTQWRLERRTGAVLYLDLATNAQGQLEATRPRFLPTRVERTVDRGVAVFPAAQIPSGGASIAHAQGLLGQSLIALDGCVSP